MNSVGLNALPHVSAHRPDLLTPSRAQSDGALGKFEGRDSENGVPLHSARSSMEQFSHFGCGSDGMSLTDGHTAGVGSLPSSTRLPIQQQLVLEEIKLQVHVHDDTCLSHPHKAGNGKKRMRQPSLDERELHHTGSPVNAALLRHNSETSPERHSPLVGDGSFAQRKAFHTFSESAGANLTTRSASQASNSPSRRCAGCPSDGPRHTRTHQEEEAARPAGEVRGEGAPTGTLSGGPLSSGEAPIVEAECAACGSCGDVPHPGGGEPLGRRTRPQAAAPQQQRPAADGAAPGPAATQSQVHTSTFPCTASSTLPAPCFSARDGETGGVRQEGCVTSAGGGTGGEGARGDARERTGGEGYRHAEGVLQPPTPPLPAPKRARHGYELPGFPPSAHPTTMPPHAPLAYARPESPGIHIYRPHDCASSESEGEGSDMDTCAVVMQEGGLGGSSQVRVGMSLMPALSTAATSQAGPDVAMSEGVGAVARDEGQGQAAAPAAHPHPTHPRTGAASRPACAVTAAEGSSQRTVKGGSGDESAVDPLMRRRPPPTPGVALRTGAGGGEGAGGGSADEAEDACMDSMRVAAAAIANGTACTAGTAVDSQGGSSSTQQHYPHRRQGSAARPSALRQQGGTGAVGVAVQVEGRGDAPTAVRPIPRAPTGALAPLTLRMGSVQQGVGLKEPLPTDRSLSSVSRLSVRFASGTKPHDGPLPLHAAFDRLVWNFCTGRLGPAGLSLPVPETLAVRDTFAGYLPPGAAAWLGTAQAMLAQGAESREEGGAPLTLPAHDPTLTLLSSLAHTPPSPGVHGQGRLPRYLGTPASPLPAGDCSVVLAAMEARRCAVERERAVPHAWLAALASAHVCQAREVAAGAVSRLQARTGGQRGLQGKGETGTGGSPPESPSTAVLVHAMEELGHEGVRQPPDAMEEDGAASASTGRSSPSLASLSHYPLPAVAPCGDTPTGAAVTLGLAFGTAAARAAFVPQLVTLHEDVCRQVRQWCAQVGQQVRWPEHQGQGAGEVGGRPHVDTARRLLLQGEQPTGRQWAGGDAPLTLRQHSSRGSEESGAGSEELVDEEGERSSVSAEHHHAQAGRPYMHQHGEHREDQSTASGGSGEAEQLEGEGGRPASGATHASSGDYSSGERSHTGGEGEQGAWAALPPLPPLLAYLLGGTQEDSRPVLDASSVTLSRLLSPALPTPPSLSSSIETVYHDRRYADGDALLLRGMLCLAEGLEARLVQIVQAMGGPGAQQEEGEEEEEGEAVSSLPLPAPASARPKVQVAALHMHVPGPPTPPTSSPTPSPPLSEQGAGREGRSSAFRAPPHRPPTPFLSSGRGRAAGSAPGGAGGGILWDAHTPQQEEEEGSEGEEEGEEAGGTGDSHVPAAVCTGDGVDAHTPPTRLLHHHALGQAEQAVALPAHHVDIDIPPEVAAHLEELSASPEAEQAAAAYRAKRAWASVPVLAGGGGSSAKLGAQHLQLVRQMTLLLRHAVRAYPTELQMKRQVQLFWAAVQCNGAWGALLGGQHQPTPALLGAPAAHVWPPHASSSAPAVAYPLGQWSQGLPYKQQ